MAPRPKLFGCVEDGGVFAHRMCTNWYKSLSQPLKCDSLTPTEAPELARLQAASYVGVM